MYYSFNLWATQLRFLLHVCVAKVNFVLTLKAKTSTFGSLLLNSAAEDFSVIGGLGLWRRGGLVLEFYIRSLLVILPVGNNHIGEVAVKIEQMIQTFRSRMYISLHFPSL